MVWYIVLLDLGYLYKLGIFLEVYLNTYVISWSELVYLKLGT